MVWKTSIEAILVFESKCFAFGFLLLFEAGSSDIPYAGQVVSKSSGEPSLLRIAVLANMLRFKQDRGNEKYLNYGEPAWPMDVIRPVRGLYTPLAYHTNCP